MENTTEKKTKREMINRVVVMERRNLGRILSVRLKVLGRRFGGESEVLEGLVSGSDDLPLSLVLLDKERQLVSAEFMNDTAVENVLNYIEDNEDGIKVEKYELPQLNKYNIRLNKLIKTTTDVAYGEEK